VHYVTEQLDGGAPIVQASLPIQAGDNPASLAARILHIEHRIYPLTAQWFAEGRLQLRDNRALLDGAPLPATGFIYRG
jgi:phosphoribosylglycinamide formyltransferase-1